MTTFDYYLLRRYAQIFMILFVSLYGLFVVFDGFSNVDAYQQAGDSTSVVLLRMAKYYGYQASAFFGQVGPLLSVISVMVVLGLLYRNSEIAPILAAGIPLFRIAVPLIAGTVIVHLVLTANQEFVLPKIAPMLMSRSAGDEHGKMVDPVLDHRSHIRLDGQALHMDRQTLEAPLFTIPPRLTGTLMNLSAETGHYEKATADRPGGWMLEGLTVRYDSLELTEDGKEILLPGRDANSVFVVSGLGFDQMYHRDSSVRFLSTSAILNRLNDPSFDQATAMSSSIHLHSRLTRPIMNVIAVLISVPLLIRKESRSLIANAAICTFVLGGVSGLQIVTEYMGTAKTISAELAVWLPIIGSGGYAAWVSRDALT